MKLKVMVNGLMKECDVDQRSAACIEITHGWDIPGYYDDNKDRPDDLDESYRQIAIETFGFTKTELDERDPNTMWVWNTGLI